MVNFHLAPQKAAGRKIKKFPEKKKNFKKRKKIEISASEFMLAASLASLADFKVSNSENSEISEIPKKSEIPKFLKFRKNLKFRNF